MFKDIKFVYRQCFFLNLKKFVVRTLFLMAKCQKVSFTVSSNIFSVLSLHINFIIPKQCI